MTQNERENILKMFLSNDKETRLLACDLIITYPNFEKIKNKELEKVFTIGDKVFHQIKIPIIKLMQRIKITTIEYESEYSFAHYDDIERILQFL